MEIPTISHQSLIRYRYTFIEKDVQFLSQSYQCSVEALEALNFVLFDAPPAFTGEATSQSEQIVHFNTNFPSRLFYEQFLAKDLSSASLSCLDQFHHFQSWRALNAYTPDVESIIASLCQCDSMCLDSLAAMLQAVGEYLFTDIRLTKSKQANEICLYRKIASYIAGARSEITPYKILHKFKSLERKAEFINGVIQVYRNVVQPDRLHGLIFRLVLIQNHYQSFIADILAGLEQECYVYPFAALAGVIKGLWADKIMVERDLKQIHKRILI